jgi:hypothetical protein
LLNVCYGHKKRPKHQQDLEKQNNNKETLKEKSLSVGDGIGQK